MVKTSDPHKRSSDLQWHTARQLYLNRESKSSLGLATIRKMLRDVCCSYLSGVGGSSATLAGAWWPL